MIVDDRRNIEQLDSQRAQLQTTQRRVAELEQVLREKEEYGSHLMEMVLID